VDAVLIASSILYVRANHYGQLAGTSQFYEMATTECVEKMLLQPNQEMEAATKLHMFIWWTFAIDMNHTAPLRAACEKLGCTWAKADDTVAKDGPHSSVPIRPHGDKTEGMAFGAEAYGWLYKLSYVLLADGALADVDAKEIIASLPSWEEHLAIVCVG
jgi:hypothetical protein